MGFRFCKIRMKVFSYKTRKQTMKVNKQWKVAFRNSFPYRTHGADQYITSAILSRHILFVYLHLKPAHTTDFRTNWSL